MCVCVFVSVFFFLMGLTDTNYFLMVELVVADKFQNPSWCGSWYGLSCFNIDIYMNFPMG